MKVTIIDAYTWYNKGDAGILIGTLNQINNFYEKEGIKDLKIDIFSFTPESDEVHYKEIKNVSEVQSNLLNPYPFSKTKAGKSKAIAKLAYNSIIQNITFKVSKKTAAKKYPQIKKMFESDIIIVCGGGFLGGKKFNSLMHLHQINIAAQLGKPIFLWGTSIEPPTNKVLKRITETVINKIDHVYPREEITYKYLSGFLSSKNYTFTPDLAFMVPSEINAKVEDLYKSLPHNKTLIGLTVRDWHFPKSSNKKDALNNYKNSIISLIEEKSAELKASFVFIPQVIFTGDDDRIIAREIKNSLSAKCKDDFIILEDDLSPQEIKGLISKFDMFVGTRMHSNIFATGAHIPTVAIAYEAKTNGIMDMLGLSKYTVNIEEITPMKINSLVSTCFENKDSIKKHLETEIPKVQQQIEKKSTFLRRGIV
ncbi:polysaccharide pyruvyl transferase family protein [Domibacillus sp.]|uniref:polysaccharide pyruvyl transferase family protein n=1 Tax=Domibacillus sp. TaxID=1969783 RepID=UPI002810E1BF|nr:polysaccharide pyruvyl transferase family protein [Domibacillus sp.]